MQLHAWHIAVFMLAGSTYTHVTCSDTLDPSVLMIEDLGRSEPGIDLYPQSFSLLSQPATDVAHGDNVIAFIVSRLGDHKIWQLDGTLLAQVEEKLVTFYLGFDRRSQLFPIGEEFIECTGFEHCTGQYMGSDL